MIILRDLNKVDNRHVVDIKNNYSFANAVVVVDSKKNEYEYITYMIDDKRTWSNEAIIDATEAEKEQYRKYTRKFKTGDKVVIKRGRKMLNEVKEIKDFFTYSPRGTYGHCDTHYLIFTDGTKVNRMHCDFI